MKAKVNRFSVTVYTYISVETQSPFYSTIKQETESLILVGETECDVEVDANKMADAQIKCIDLNIDRIGKAHANDVLALRAARHEIQKLKGAK